MGSIDHLRRQHRELLRLAKEIMPFLQGERPAHDFTAARLRLSAFVRKLGVHIALVDRFIYARLSRHSDPNIVAKAAEHRQDLHALRARVNRYTLEWISTAIAADGASPKFIDETKIIFELLFKRLEAEDSEIYPLVERICRPSGTWPIDLRTEGQEARRVC